MPVLLALDPSSSANKGMHVLGAHYPLKNAFFACLKCSHPGAAPVYIYIYVLHVYKSSIITFF